MSEDSLIQQIRALELDNARLRHLLNRHGSTTGLRHQARNTLAMVRDVVRQSAERFDDVEEFVALLQARLDAVFRIQNTIANRLLDGVDLGVLITDELLGHAISEGEQLSVQGPEIILLPAAAGMMALAVHELASNAITFGSLSTPEGRLAVSWTIISPSDDAVPVLEFVWLESGAGNASPIASRRGFGSEVIESALRYQLGGEGRLDFVPGGLRCTVSLPLTPALASLPSRPRKELDDGRPDA